MASLSITLSSMLAEELEGLSEEDGVSQNQILSTEAVNTRNKKASAPGQILLQTDELAALSAPMTVPVNIELSREAVGAIGILVVLYGLPREDVLRLIIYQADSDRHGRQQRHRCDRSTCYM